MRVARFCPRLAGPVAACSLAALLLLAPRAGTAEELDDGGFLDPLGGKTYGSLQYAGGVVEAGVNFGVVAGGGAAWGFHYVERGSMLAQMIMSSASSAGAHERARQTGQSQTYYVDNSPDSAAALRFDLLSNDEDTAVNVDFFYGIPLGDAPLPFVLDIGTGFSKVETKDDEAGFLHLYAGLVAPVTRWAQIEGAARLVLGGPWFSWELAGVGNIGNRYFVRARIQGFEGTTYGVNLGVKL